MGMGGGPGMGRGMGGGMGRGMGRTGVGSPVPETADPTPSPQADGQQELAALKAEALAMEQHAQAINERITEIEGVEVAAGLLAAVDAEQCSACSRCETVCPTDAIRIDQTAVIDQAKCTGCGQCVAECPQGAITLRKR
jgi:ferredoxin